MHDDIAFSILSKLPIKSIKRFSCVHKSWINLFENPTFLNMFRNNLLLKFNSHYADDDDVCLILNQYGWDFYLLDGDKVSE
jgi:molecular chaperone HtpG